MLMTMIARIADGLPLAASMQEDEQVTSLQWCSSPNSTVLVYFFTHFSPLLQDLGLHI